MRMMLPLISLNPRVKSSKLACQSSILGLHGGYAIITFWKKSSNLRHISAHL